MVWKNKQKKQQVNTMVADDLGVVSLTFRELSKKFSLEICVLHK